MDPPLLCGPGMDPDRGCQAGHGAGPDSGTPGGVRLQCRGHVPLRDLGLSVAVHDRTGDRCGGVLRVCRDLHTHTAAAARSAAILPVVPRRRSAPTRCAAGSAAPTTGGAAVDRPDVVLPLGEGPREGPLHDRVGDLDDCTHGMTPRSRLFAIGGSVPERLMALAGVPPVGRSCRRRVPHRSLFGPRPRECR